MVISDTLTVFIVLLVNDFLRAVVIRFLNHCWCWDLEYTFVSVQAILSVQSGQSGSISKMIIETKNKGHAHCMGF